MKKKSDNQQSRNILGKKKKVTQRDIAALANVDQGSVSRILNMATRERFSRETVEKVFKVARELGYLHPALVSSNRRASPRKACELQAKCRIIIGTNTVWDEGECTISEVSLSGMLLTRLETPKHTLPIDKFRIELEVLTPPLKGLKGRYEVSRFAGADNEFALAIKYVDMPAEWYEKVKQFVGFEPGPQEH